MIRQKLIESHRCCALISRCDVTESQGRGGVIPEAVNINQRFPVRRSLHSCERHGARGFLLCGDRRTEAAHEPEPSHQVTESCTGGPLRDHWGTTGGPVAVRSGAYVWRGTRRASRVVTVHLKLGETFINFRSDRYLNIIKYI